MPRAREIIEQEIRRDKGGMVAVSSELENALLGKNLADLEQQAVSLGLISDRQQLQDRFMLFRSDGRSLVAFGRIQTIPSAQFEAASQWLGLPEADQVLVRDAAQKVVARDVQSLLQDRQHYEPEEGPSDADVEADQAARSRARKFYVGLEVKQNGGEIVVDRVQPRGPASRAGLRPGDTLLFVGSYPVESTKGYKALAHLIGIGKPIGVRVRRDGTVYKTLLTPANIAAFSSSPFA